MTTATAVTSNGQPAPAGLSTRPTATSCRRRCPAGRRRRSATRSCSTTSSGTTGPARASARHGPWHRRGGRRTLRWITGISGPPTAVAPWLRRTRSSSRALWPRRLRRIHTRPARQTSWPTHRSLTPTTSRSSSPRGERTRTSSARLIVGLDVPPKLLGDYHLAGTGSPAFNLGAASKAIPTYQGGGSTRGADDRHRRPASASPGCVRRRRRRDPASTRQPLHHQDRRRLDLRCRGPVTYTIVVANAGPDLRRRCTRDGHVPELA